MQIVTIIYLFNSLIDNIFVLLFYSTAFAVIVLLLAFFHGLAPEVIVVEIHQAPPDAIVVEALWTSICCIYLMSLLNPPRVLAKSVSNSRGRFSGAIVSSRGSAFCDRGDFLR
jgi:hypothetical protein